jgi:hypothetical protein
MDVGEPAWGAARRIPAEGRSSVSTEQKQNLDAILRQPAFPHVFQAYYPILDEAAATLDRAGQLLSAHLASAERVTA